ncbi:lamin tail domain-containing protein [Streptomyces sp. NPDC021562]|uniref:lamin tail domain-containing protein n=1 Tax=Streptomyces sp. NPDC021562 TaxID=3155121 RepID=UPI003400B384
MSDSVTVTARRLGSATAVAAALVGALALPAAAATPHRGQVVISAVQHEVQGREVHSNRALNREWVDVTNTTRRDVNLSGWTLADASGRTYTFHHYRLAGRATVRVHTGVGRDTDKDLYQDRRDSVWNRNADTVILRDDHRDLVDSVTWGHRHRDAGGGEHRGDERGGNHRGDERGGNHRGDERGGNHRGDERGGNHRGDDGRHMRR